MDKKELQELEDEHNRKLRGLERLEMDLVANVLYLGSRISKDSKGNLIFHHGTTPIG